MRLMLFYIHSTAVIPAKAGNHLLHKLRNQIDQIPATRRGMLECSPVPSFFILQLVKDQSCQSDPAKHGSRIECE